MSFRLKADESVPKGVRRLALEQLDKAREALDRRGEDPVEAVHDARKCFKRLRALGRLVRDELGEGEYRRDNALFRDAARPLSEVRDAHALLQAADALAERCGEVPPQAWATLRGGLERRERRVSGALRGEVIEPILDALDEGERRVKKWRIGRGFSALAPGLRQSCRRARTAFDAARAEPTTENLHEWRKLVKYLWHHLQVVQAIRPDVLDDLADRMHRLGDLLGDDHDLAVLASLLDQGAVSAGEGASGVRAAIERSRAELQREALQMGDEIHRDRPKDLVELLGAYWHEWRWASEAAKLEAARSGG
jgi:CHAD domain-containing protein